MVSAGGTQVSDCAGTWGAACTCHTPCAPEKVAARGTACQWGVVNPPGKTPPHPVSPASAGRCCFLLPGACHVPKATVIFRSPCFQGEEPLPPAGPCVSLRGLAPEWVQHPHGAHPACVSTWDGMFWITLLRLIHHSGFAFCSFQGHLCHSLRLTCLAGCRRCQVSQGPCRQGPGCCPSLALRAGRVCTERGSELLGTAH